MCPRSQQGNQRSRGVTVNSRIDVKTYGSEEGLDRILPTQSYGDYRHGRGPWILSYVPVEGNT